MLYLATLLIQLTKKMWVNARKHLQQFTLLVPTGFRTNFKVNFLNLTSNPILSLHEAILTVHFLLYYLLVNIE